MAERLMGNATTDFGAPGVIPPTDLEKAGAAEDARFAKVLGAGWRALDAARRRAEGKALSSVGDFPCAAIPARYIFWVLPSIIRNESSVP